MCVMECEKVQRGYQRRERDGWPSGGENEVMGKVVPCSFRLENVWLRESMKTRTEIWNEVGDVVW